MTHKYDTLLHNGIFITTKGITNKRIDVIISVLSEEELKEYDITDATNAIFNTHEWHKIVAEPDNPKSVSKYYGLVHMLIKKYLKSEKNILLHSTEDQVRAAQLFITYLILVNNWEPFMAIEYLKRVKPEIRLPQEYVAEIINFYDNIHLYNVNNNTNIIFE
jgi:hypothetical protein